MKVEKDQESVTVKTSEKEIKLKCSCKCNSKETPTREEVKVQCRIIGQWCQLWQGEVYLTTMLVWIYRVHNRSHGLNACDTNVFSCFPSCTSHRVQVISL